MSNRVEVRIPVEGIELGAWLFIPHSHGKKHPAITMAHGFAGTKDHGLERFAGLRWQTGENSKVRQGTRPEMESND